MKPPVNTVNHAALDIWSPRSAYFIGYFCADGNLQHKTCGTKLLSFGCGRKDEDYLYQIVSLIDLSVRIRRYEHPTRGVVTYHVCACSKQLYDRLFSLGITPKKSLILKWIEDVPPRFLHHFVRGYLDGDGCVQHCIRGKRNFLRLRLVGTEHFIAGMHAAIVAQAPHLKGTYRKHSTKPTWELDFNGRFAGVAFADWLYTDSNPALRMDRKYRIYKRYKEQIEETAV